MVGGGVLVRGSAVLRRGLRRDWQGGWVTALKVTAGSSAESGCLQTKIRRDCGNVRNVGGRN
jgi:hypothetical protein